MSSRPVFVVIGTSSAIFVSFLAWRARSQAEAAAEHAQQMVADGPMVNFESETERARIIEAALHRGVKWISYQISGANDMVGQVGGVSVHKRPLLTLDPDYVLKPLNVDHRGIRAITFYEALEAAAHKTGVQAYASFWSTRSTHKTHFVDVLAFSIALWIRDPVVLECERRIMLAWDHIRQEARSFQRLHQFTPKYYGVVLHETSPQPLENQHTEKLSPYGIGHDYYLLLEDATVNFKRPCVIDIKMGLKSYEPDAPKDKRVRERKKYMQQEEFGLRIVGMRVYEPSSSKSCKNGFVFYSKEYGRSLSTKDALKDALRTYLAAGSSSNEHCRSRSIVKILIKLRSIEHWFRDNKSVAFYSSSLLIAYEGNSESGNRDMVNVKMIDFGRVRRQAGGDPGYLHGLRTLTNLLEEILKENDKLQE